MASHVFDELGYRRVEWKCNALDEPSRRAAERFGFTFEGLFRRAMIVRGRSRDTAWYSIIDEEWPDVKAGYAAWSGPVELRRRRPSAVAAGRSPLTRSPHGFLTPSPKTPNR